MSNGKNKIYIQDAKGIGTYVEMEQKNLLLENNNGDTIEKMKNILKEYDWKIDTSDYLVRKAYAALKNILWKIMWSFLKLLVKILYIWYNLIV